MVDTNTNIKWLIRICIFPNAAYCKYETSCGTICESSEGTNRKNIPRDIFCKSTLKNS